MEQRDQQPHIYTDAEIQPALQELFSYPHLVGGIQSFFPEPLPTLLLQEKDRVASIVEFQAKIIRPVMKAIEISSIDQLSNTGLDQLDPNKRYLFISNHRDIILDSAFLNIVLFDNGFTTSQIAIGDNLIKHRISELIFRMNKSFVVKRSGSPMELYRYSVLLANYIKAQITTLKDSVWLAQREGRSKDGNDRTQAAVLKMLSLGHSGDLKAHFKDLNIVPLSISYEYDPCDVLKTQEYLNKINDPEYKKSFEEDLQHILRGLKGSKGRVHFHFGSPVCDILDSFDNDPKGKQFFEQLATHIDQEIHKNYALFPVNYVAFDLLKNTGTYQDQYSQAALEDMKRYFETRLGQLLGEKEGLGRGYLLGMYANMVVNHAAATSFIPEYNPLNQDIS